jgi:transposase
MVRVGLDLSRKRGDVCLISEQGELIAHFRAPADRDGLYADAQRVKGLAPLARETDKIDARVLAELSVRDLVPAIWLPTVELRGEREISRWRLPLARHGTTRKNRVHSTLICFGCQVPMADLFGVAGRRLLAGLDIPEPWRGHVDASLELIDDLKLRIARIEGELQRSGAEHRYVPLLMTAPGLGWITSFTVACQIGDIDRFSSPVKLTGSTGLCARVSQSGDTLQSGDPRYRSMRGRSAADVVPLAERAVGNDNVIEGLLRERLWLINALVILLLGHRLDAAARVLSYVLATSRAAGSGPFFAMASAFSAIVALQRGAVEDAKTDARAANAIDGIAHWQLAANMATLVEALIERGCEHEAETELVDARLDGALPDVRPYTPS